MLLVFTAAQSVSVEEAVNVPRCSTTGVGPELMWATVGGKGATPSCTAGFRPSTSFPT